ncbi:hypothetical protein ACFQ48_09285 [Hymenobacter caeli]|uniref:Lipid-binding transport protein (Tim44 family) n=1 Tax=Hymenobacter caeli TaxID=2735894 RepID=A0ABX2FNY4_9BACT|nr:hypothetical protein [Hymenobacter caeli]NRT18261.1 putative lipid-binding transport protein (Tim44 family) [Hymenobacter caeli]
MNRLFILLLLSLLLGACTLLHPYRLPTPPVSPELKAQRKAAERARQQSARAAGKHRKQKEEAAAAPPPGAAPAAADAAPAKEPSAANKVKYDKKTGLVKKPKLMRRRVHKAPKKPFKPFEAIGNLFHPKSHPHANPKPSSPRPAPAP